MKKENKHEEKTFEKEILKSVYKYEAKRTYKTIMIIWIVFIIAQFLIVIIGSHVYETLKQQETLDLLQLFQEDMEIIKENFVDVLYVLYTESPQLLVLILGILVLALSGIIFFTIKNFKKIRNRISSMNKFFAKK